tara:strand:- start:3215 stop:3643 length:429 start_codon:yes stop_codon:yes gene_type:complete
MKRLTILFLFLAQVAFSQEVPKEFQKMNTMVVVMDSEDALTEIAKKLMSENFDIEVIDQDLQYLRTMPITKDWIDWQVRVKVNGNKVEFQSFTSSKIRVNGVSGEGFELTNFKSPRGPYREISEGLFVFVSSLGKKIQYFEK